MTKKVEKPTPEAKALSLFLMAYKTKSPRYKEQSKHINKMWDLVVSHDITREEYNKEVNDMLDSYGGYSEVVEKTVKFYIEKSGEWKLQGDDKYCKDARDVAKRILNT